MLDSGGIPRELGQVDDSPGDQDGSEMIVLHASVEVMSHFWSTVSGAWSIGTSQPSSTCRGGTARCSSLRTINRGGARWRPTATRRVRSSRFGTPVVWLPGSSSRFQVSSSADLNRLLIADQVRRFVGVGDRVSQAAAADVSPTSITRRIPSRLAPRGSRSDCQPSIGSVSTSIQSTLPSSVICPCRESHRRTTASRCSASG